MDTTKVQPIALSEPAAAALASYADWTIYLSIDSADPQDSTTIRRKGLRLVRCADLADAAMAGILAPTADLLEEIRTGADERARMLEEEAANYRVAGTHDATSLESEAAGLRTLLAEVAA